MKKYIIYLLLSIYIFIMPIISKQINKIYIPLFWILLLIITKQILKNTEKIKRGIGEKKDTLAIVMIIYTTIYFFSGLFFGYGKSPYNQSFLGILLNIWLFISEIFCKEIIRSDLINKNSSKKNYLIIILLFTSLDINVFNFLFQNPKISIDLDFVFNILLFTLAKNILLTYLVKVGNYFLSLIYLIPNIGFTLICPIIPNIESHVLTIINLILMIIIYIKISNIHNQKTIKQYRVKKKSKYYYIVYFTLATILSFFFLGMFKYVPTAIMSNSMSTKINRGDIVVVEKEKKTNKIKENDIIQYQLEGYYVIHRVIKIEKINNKIIFITKGDNNKKEDRKKVEVKQVIGVVKFKLPKLGYPAVWLAEFLKKNKVSVET